MLYGFSLFLSVLVPCHSVSAQAGRTITVRIVESKTGERITPSGLLVRVNHEMTEHNEWVHENEDGTLDVTLPSAASTFLFRATYDSSTAIYVNCDGMKRYEGPSPRWYSVAQVLTEGIVAQNGCVNQAREDKIKATAAPGEIVMYVRKPNWREESKD